MGRHDAIRGQLKLFDSHEVPPKYRAVGNGNTKPKWTKYAPGKAKNPYRCDFCKLNQKDDLTAPVARQARYIRKAQGDSLYLCVEHANDQRVIDGLPQVKGRS